jgi:heme-degrading monooxygenase HmoA
MATVMNMHWPEVTREQYEIVRQDVNWEGDVPKGAKFHVAWFADDGFRVLDLWESAEDFQAFVAQRLTPGVAKAGIQGEPKIQLSPTHAIFAPNP